MNRSDHLKQNKVYQQILQQNVTTLMCLSKQEYPNLYKRLTVHGGSLRAKLILLLEDGISKCEYDTAKQNGVPLLWWYASNRYLVDFNPMKVSSMNKALSLLSIFGFFQKRNSRNVKIEDLSVEDCQNLYYAGVRQRRRRVKTFRPTLLYHVPSYDEKLLAMAEISAKRWNDSGLTMKSISKKTLIRVFGQEAANIAFHDERVIPESDKKLEAELSDALKELLKIKGFARLDELFRWAEGNQRSRKRVWDSAKSDIMRALDVIYGKPTKEEKERWKLPDYKYIITTRKFTGGEQSTETISIDGIDTQGHRI